MSVIQQLYGFRRSYRGAWKHRLSAEQTGLSPFWRDTLAELVDGPEMDGTQQLKAATAEWGRLWEQALRPMLDDDTFAEIHPTIKGLKQASTAEKYDDEMSALYDLLNEYRILVD